MLMGPEKLIFANDMSSSHIHRASLSQSHNMCQAVGSCHLAMHGEGPARGTSLHEGKQHFCCYVEFCSMILHAKCVCEGRGSSACKYASNKQNNEIV